MTVADNHVWFDTLIVPHLALSGHGLRLVSILLLAPAIVLGATLVIFNAWPATCFVGAESLLAVLALHWCARRLSQQGERVTLTDSDLIVERWNRGVTRRERLEPGWVCLERQEHEDFGCEAIFLRVSRRRVRIGAALGAEARAELAAALQAALEKRKQDLHLGR